LVETTNGLIRVEDFDSARKVEIYTGDNSFPQERAMKYIATPLQDVYEVKMGNGYVVRCSEKHQLMTMDGWKTPLEITAGDFVEKAPIIDAWGNESIDEKTAWLLGVLVSEGSVTNKNVLSVKNTDRQLISTLEDDYGFTAYHRDDYMDDRFGKCKESWDANLCDAAFRKDLLDMGLEHVTSHEKKIPSKILQSPKESVVRFLSGLFDGDGSCFLWSDKGVEGKIGLSYYSVSERLCRDVQVLMSKLGYDGYITSRSSDLSENKQWMVRWNGKVAFDAATMLDVPRFKDVLDECHYVDNTPKPHYDKSRSKWKVNFVINGKKVQKRFESQQAAQDFLDDAKSVTQYRKVVSVTKLDEQDNLYDYYLPQTNSFYAEGHRQHNSIPRDIFENVVAGFAAVAASPIEKVKQKAREKRAKELGIPVSNKKKENFNNKSNQIILSGTAYYDFNHFAEYWKRYKSIVTSGGDERALSEVFGGAVSEDFDWTEYSVMRIPVQKLPDGFMDSGQIARAKATVHSGIYNMEYGAVFTTDSQGFFKRSLIESCTTSHTDPVKLPSGDICFEAMLKGDPNKKYIFGVDPASEVDNFSIVVLELNSDHRKIVHSWTTTRKQHKEKLKSKLVTEDDFYSYCAKKIRELMKAFPCVEIAIDAQGGGIAVVEALQDKDKIPDGGVQIWPVIEEKEKETDFHPGLHILKLCQFAKADWLAEANHGLRKDFEDKLVLFPFFDSASIGLSIESDKASGRKYDTLEDCVMEIEELKDELSMIVMTQTSTGRERWDTPEVKLGAGKKSRLRKDRYSSLIMANMSARNYKVVEENMEMEVGGFAVMNSSNLDKSGKMYNGPSWFTDKIQDIY
jgi:intein/homing endonuclease